MRRLRQGEIVLADGGWGTELQHLGLASGDCPEAWNVTRPEVVRGVAERYLRAGAEITLTNTFGANRFRLLRHGEAERVRELNLAGARLSLEAAKLTGGIVFASVGPTGEFVQPEGMLTRAEMKAAYIEQMSALKEAGIGAVCIETMYVVDETLVAIEAAKELGLLCVASMTFDAAPTGFQTMLETPLPDAVRALEASPVDMVGTNCGNGMNELLEIARQMRQLTSKPLWVRPNAGLPTRMGNQLVYSETPLMMAEKLGDLRALGVSVIGGCCGTTPEHIAAFKRKL